MSRRLGLALLFAGAVFLRDLYPLDAAGVATLYSNPSFVQAASNLASSASSISITFGQSPKVGDIIACGVASLAGSDLGPTGWQRYRRVSNAGIALSTYVHAVNANDTAGPYTFSNSVSTTLHLGCAEYANVDTVRIISSSQVTTGTLATAGAISLGTIRSTISGSLPVLFSAGTLGASASQTGWTNAWDSDATNPSLSAHSQYYNTTVNNGGTWAATATYAASPGTYVAQELVLIPKTPPDALVGASSGYVNVPFSLSMASTSNCLIFPGLSGAAGIQVSGSTWTGALSTQGSSDVTHYAPIQAVNESNPNAISSTISANGLYGINTAGLNSIEICVSSTGNNSVSIGYTPNAYSAVFSLENTTVPVSLLATPIPWSNASPQPHSLPVPTPVATSIDDSIVPSTGTHSFVFPVGERSYQLLACDLESFDSIAVLTAYSAYDPSNTYPQLAQGYYIQGQNYSTNLSDNGQYIFPLNGAQFLDLDVTSPSTGMISISCIPSYYDRLRTIDANGYQYGNVAAQKSPLPVTTPAPLVTSSPGNQITNQDYCPSTFTAMTANGGTVYACLHKTTGEKTLSTTNVFSISSLLNSSNTGSPNASGIFSDNPANASCNGSNAGIWCGITLTTTSVVPVATGLSGKSIYLMGFTLSNSSNSYATLQFYQGTGGSCGTSQAAIGTPIQIPPQRSLVHQITHNPLLTTTQNDDLCAALSGAISSVYLNADISQF